MIEVGVAEQHRQAALALAELAGHELLAVLGGAGAEVDEQAVAIAGHQLDRRRVAAVAQEVGAAHRERAAHAPEADLHAAPPRTPTVSTMPSHAVMTSMPRSAPIAR